MKPREDGMRDQEIRAALDQHWAASDANDFETEHSIYHADAGWNTRSQAGASAVDATYKSHALNSRAKGASSSGESRVTMIFGSPNTS